MADEFRGEINQIRNLLIFVHYFKTFGSFCLFISLVFSNIIINHQKKFVIKIMKPFSQSSRVGWKIQWQENASILIKNHARSMATRVTHYCRTKHHKMAFIHRPTHKNRFPKN